MPFELIVQAAFTERLEGGGVRIRRVGEHITHREHIEALGGSPNVVRVWTDEQPNVALPAPASAPAKS